MGRVLLVADFGDGTYEAKNCCELNRVERLAIRHQPGEPFPWEILALRKGFPTTLHQNSTAKNSPKSLCVYAQPWSHVERSWTPEKFIRQILWWLRATAEGNIHPADQPLEGLFFCSPIEVILPPDVFTSDGALSAHLVFDRVPQPNHSQIVLLGKHVEERPNHKDPSCIPVFVPLSPLAEGAVEDLPFTLGELSERISSRGSDLVTPLSEAIQASVEDGITIEDDHLTHLLIITVTPRVRNGDTERHEFHGFWLEWHLGKLGQALGVLINDPDNRKKWYVDVNIFHTDKDDADTDWQQNPIMPVRVSAYNNHHQVRNFSGLNDAGSDLNILLAGAGSLGGAIAQILEKECWGNWSYIDDDTFKPHNTTRHIADHNAVGHPKALVLDRLLTDLHSPPRPGTSRKSRHLAKDVLADNAELHTLLEQQDLVIDATTMLHVPRELAHRACGRVASLFITPSGTSSVLLLEDSDRSIRSDHLEAQYYRAILEAGWGAKHLSKNLSWMWVGAGCREVTVSMPYELIMLHAAQLARQLRMAVSSSHGVIGVWTLDESSGAISAFLLPPSKPRTVTLGNWTICWDQKTENHLDLQRARRLPDETGGILLGYVDHKAQTIWVVQATEAPEGSSGSPSSFARKSALAEHQTASKKTAGIVNYIGEWHSHPKVIGVTPSSADLYQLAFVGGSVQADGDPTVMFIVGEKQIGISIHEPSKSQCEPCIVHTLTTDCS